MVDSQQNEIQQTMDKVYTGRTSNLAELLKDRSFPDNAFFLAENIPMHAITDRQARQDLLYFTCMKDLKDQNQDWIIDIEAYTSGRIFCPEFELRWQQRRDSGDTHLIYTGPTTPCLDFLKPYLKKPINTQENLTHSQVRRYYLFGEILRADDLRKMGLQTEGDEKRLYYAEVRIPRLLRYPQPKEQSSPRRVQLIVSEYLDERTQEVLWFRFQDLEGEQLEPKKGGQS